MPLTEPFDEFYDLPDRQKDAITLQREIMTLPPGAAFHCSFTPHQTAVDLLARLAAADTPLAAEAAAVLQDWRDALATPEQVEMVDTSVDLEVGGGAYVSTADGEGFWISTWTWIDTPDDTDCTP